MSAILDKLLKGQKVEWKTLGDASVLYGGLTGKNKADFENGNAKYVSYKNIFANLAVDLQNLGTVKVNENEKQHFIKHGDILFTGTPSGVGRVEINDHLEGFLEERKLFDFYKYHLKVMCFETLLNCFSDSCYSFWQSWGSPSFSRSNFR